MTQRHGTAAKAVHGLLRKERRSSSQFIYRAHTRIYDFAWWPGGGRVKPGETPEEALARELAEEFGIDAAIGNIERVYELHRPRLDGGGQWVDIICNVWWYEGQIRNVESRRHNAIGRFELSHLPPNQIVPHVRFALDALARGERLSELDLEWFVAQGGYRITRTREGSPA